MAGVAVDVGTGTTLTVPNTPETTTWTANLLSLAWGDTTRDVVETTHMTTPATAASNVFGTSTFMPVDIADTGTLTAEVQFNPDPGTAGALVFPIHQDAETITITFPNAATWEFDGFCTGAEMNDPMEDVMTASLTFRASGGVTIA
jgi:hypothetical protein